MDHLSVDSDNSHSQLLVPMIQSILKKNGFRVNDLNGIVIAGGPGSYTGLRIGASTAKGIAYSLNIPVFAVSTLESMMADARQHHKQDGYFCAMLDARRMEVYTLISDATGVVVRSIQPEIVAEDSFPNFRDKPFYFFGWGADKCKKVLQNEPFVHLDGIVPDAGWLGLLGYQKFLDEEAVDLAYYEPDYLKEFKAKPAKKLI
jgi:tRNA threonylcarbamoyladenosine biosynthesis protein TsaB